MRGNTKLSSESKNLIDQAKQKIDSLNSYWPLTLRQIYYQLVAAQIVPNDIHQYQKLSRLLSEARLAKIIPWECMEDRSRIFKSNIGWNDHRHFIDQEKRYILSGYRRDKMQSQPERLEIWIEKDALSGIVDRAAKPYCVSVVVARGFSSMSFKNDFRDRCERDGRKTKILYFGDFDPSGYEMLPAMMRTFEDDMDLEGQVVDIRCALNLDQIQYFNLPDNPDALKMTDSRAKKFLERFGHKSVELDALPPDTLSKLVQRSIETNIDMDLFNDECRDEKDDLKKIEDARTKINKLLEKI